MCLTLTTSGAPGVPAICGSVRPGGPPLSSPPHCHHPAVLLTGGPAQPAGPHLVPGLADHPAVGVHSVELQSRQSPPANIPTVRMIQETGPA